MKEGREDMKTWKEGEGTCGHRGEVGREHSDIEVEGKGIYI